MTNPACADDPEPQLWDSTLPGESDVDRTNRHAKALAVCAGCDAIEWCESTISEGDDGVRAGRILPHIEDKNRRSPYGESPSTLSLFRSLGEKRNTVRSPVVVEQQRLVNAGVSPIVADLLAEQIVTQKAS